MSVLLGLIPHVLYYFQYCISRFSSSIINQLLAEQLNFSEVKIQTLCFIFGISYAVVQIPVGFLLRKKSFLKLYSVLISLTSLGYLISALANNFLLLCISRLFIGIGCSMAAVGLWSYLNRYIPNQFILISGVSTSLGMIIPMILEKIIVRIENKIFFIHIIQLVFSFLVLGSIFLFSREQNKNITVSGNSYYSIIKEDIKKILYNVPAILLLINICFLVSGFYMVNDGKVDIYLRSHNLFVNFYETIQVFKRNLYYNISLKEIIFSLILCSVLIYSIKRNIIIMISSTMFFIALIAIANIKESTMLVKISYGMAGLIISFFSSYSSRLIILILTVLGTVFPLLIFHLHPNNFILIWIYSIFLGFISKAQVFTVREWVKVIDSDNYDGILAVLNCFITGIGAALLPYLNTLIMNFLLGPNYIYNKSNNYYYFLMVAIFGLISLLSFIYYCFITRFRYKKKVEIQ